MARVGPDAPARAGGTDTRVRLLLRHRAGHAERLGPVHPSVVGRLCDRRVRRRPGREPGIPAGAVRSTTRPGRVRRRDGRSAAGAAGTAAHRAVRRAERGDHHRAVRRCPVVHRDTLCARCVDSRSDQSVPARNGTVRRARSRGRHGRGRTRAGLGRRADRSADLVSSRRARERGRGAASAPGAVPVGAGGDVPVPPVADRRARDVHQRCRSAAGRPAGPGHRARRGRTGEVGGTGPRRGARAQVGGRDRRAGGRAACPPAGGPTPRGGVPRGLHGGVRGPARPGAGVGGRHARPGRAVPGRCGGGGDARPQPDARRPARVDRQRGTRLRARAAGRGRDGDRGAGDPASAAHHRAGLCVRRHRFRRLLPAGPHRAVRIHGHPGDALRRRVRDLASREPTGGQRRASGRDPGRRATGSRDIRRHVAERSRPISAPVQRDAACDNPAMYSTAQPGAMSRLAGNRSVSQG